MDRWSQGWSVPPSHSMTSGGRQWTWPAAWTAQVWAGASRYPRPRARSWKSGVSCWSYVERSLSRGWVQVPQKSGKHGYKKRKIYNKVWKKICAIYLFLKWKSCTVCAGNIDQWMCRSLHYVHFHVLIKGKKKKAVHQVSGFDWLPHCVLLRLWRCRVEWSFNVLKGQFGLQTAIDSK